MEGRNSPTGDGELIRDVRSPQRSDNYSRSFISLVEAEGASLASTMEF